MKKTQTVLVIGASRGIGHELARQYREDGATVHATCRTASDAEALRGVGCVAYLLDVTDAEGWDAFGRSLGSAQFDVAIHNAGVSGPRESGAPTRDDFDATMRTNVWAAMQMTSIVPDRLITNRGRLVIISSRMGSIAARDHANAPTYRASKAAVNSIAKDASLTYGPQGVICVAMHPGWVRTAMGGDGADLDVRDSVAGIRKTIAGLRPDDNGCFVNYDGGTLRW